MIEISKDRKESNFLLVKIEDLSSNTIITQIPQRRWSRSRKSWIIPNTRHNILMIGQLLEFFKIGKKFIIPFVGVGNHHQLPQCPANVL